MILGALEMYSTIYRCAEFFVSSRVNFYVNKIPASIFTGKLPVKLCHHQTAVTTATCSVYPVSPQPPSIV
jgi:hypothetical protein